MTEREALKLALEALKRERNNYFHGETDGAPEYLCEAITAAEEVLAQPQRAWVELSKEEIDHLVQSTPYEDYHLLVEATEALLKEKNT